MAETPLEKEKVMRQTRTPVGTLFLNNMSRAQLEAYRKTQCAEQCCRCRKSLDG